ncbi:MAG TPA: DinB family protein [Burkholderiales bacterium]
MLTRYNAWANQVIFKAVADLPEGEAVKPRPSVFKNMVHTLNHNYVIDRIFQAHLEGRPHDYTARNTADHPPLAELWRAQQELDRWYIGWSDAASEPSLDEKVRFTYVGGGEGLMSRREILQHLVVHTGYHRGFVAQMMFDIPVRPPVTDLTVYLRDVHR